jgi:diguanylate cyclase (GGDEF)-like protein
MLDLEDACARARRGDTSVIVLFDLDGFKSYNDSFGHLPGDALLRRLGQKLEAAAPAVGGKAYRLGGDEFCVLATLANRPAADDVAAMGAHELSEEGEGFHIGASFGWVVLDEETHSPSDVLAEADVRMYAYKQRGRLSAAQQTTDALVRAQHERSPLLGPHVSDVAELAQAVGERMGLSDHRLGWVRQTAELHDVGKMAIPDEVLDKPGPLTDDEWVLIREHTVIGERIVAAAPSLREVARIVRATHERFDGAGYPDGIAGEDISLEARIVNATDAYCAMTQTRPYRQAMSTEGALDELRRCAGSQFDPAVVDALIGVLHDHNAETASTPATSGTPDPV